MKLSPKYSLIASYKTALYLEKRPLCNTASLLDYDNDVDRPQNMD